MNANTPDMAAFGDLRTGRLRLAGFRFKMGEMDAYASAIDVATLFSLSADEVIDRQDYELDGQDTPGNRAINEEHVGRIVDGLGRHSDRLLVGALVFALDSGGVEDNVSWSSATRQGGPVAGFEPGYLELFQTAKLWILDGQHRRKALQELWRDNVEKAGNETIAARLRKTSIPIVIVRESDRDEISRMFVSLAKTRPIPAALLAAMDNESAANVLAQDVARLSRMFADADGTAAGRVEFQGTTPKPEKLYTAAALRAFASTMLIGFGARTADVREQKLCKQLGVAVRDIGPESKPASYKQALRELVAIIDYAFDRMPGWRDLASPGRASAGRISEAEFRAKYLHGQQAGLHVIAGVIAAARASGTNVRKSIDALAKLDWEKESRVAGPDGKQQHPQFEGTLVYNEVRIDSKGGDYWKTRNSGGQRVQYEGATRHVLRVLSRDPGLSALGESAARIAIGLESEGRRGRPRRVAS